MIQFLISIPAIVVYGCLALLAFFTAMTISLKSQSGKASKQITKMTEVLNELGGTDTSRRRDGLNLDNLDEIRVRCETLRGPAAEWWQSIESHIEQYNSPTAIPRWFLTEQTRQLLSQEFVIGKQFNSSFFSSVPGLLTGAGLTLTFIAILLALYGVHYDKANTVEPISGIDSLINGLAGKFVSSILALVLSILFTLYEKFVVRNLRVLHERLILAVSNAIPYLSPSRVLLDIQRSSAEQSVSVSNISSSVIDRFVSAFNSNIVPALTDGMSSGVATKMESEFRPTMQQMNDTLTELKAAIVGLESQKQESIIGELKGFVASLEVSLVNSLSRMGTDFHQALTGAASQEFGNVQGTLEATRTMLSEMNLQFGAMQSALSTIIEKAEQSTSEQMTMGREQTEALTSLMNGLMVRMQESADQNLNSVRSQLTLVVGDLADKVATLSKDMMSAAENVAKHSQASADHVLAQTSQWSEANAKRLEALLANIETRSNEFQSAGQALMKARDFVVDILAQNADALGRMAEASRQVQTYTTALVGQTDAMKGVGQTHAQVANHLRETSAHLRSSTEEGQKSLAEYRRSIEEYKRVIDGLDQSIGRILATIQSGLSQYNESIEGNFKKLVGVATPMISEAATFINTQIKGLDEQLEELTSAISRSVDRVNGRTK